MSRTEKTIAVATIAVPAIVAVVVAVITGMFGLLDDRDQDGPASPASPNGAAKIVKIESQDGKPGLASRVSMKIDVSSQPTNGNTLFLACYLLEEASNTNFLFVQAPLRQAGVQTLAVAFGANAVDDKEMIGSKRTCGVVTADQSATLKLAAVAGTGKPLTGDVPTPEGSFFLQEPTVVEITRLNEF